MSIASIMYLKGNRRFVVTNIVFSYYSSSSQYDNA